MSFFNNLIDWIRGINRKTSMTTIQQRPVDFVFGSIISGSYANFKHDTNPTILCLGNYMKQNGRWYVHGIQLHAIDINDLNWLLFTIKNMKQNSIITNPRIFYIYLKTNRYSIVKNGYRIYHTELTKFKTIHPGFSNISPEYCVQPFDARDRYLINNVQQYNEIDQTKLRENITNAINSKKIW